MTPSKPYEDLREFIATLEQHGKLFRVTRPINKDTELQNGSLHPVQEAFVSEYGLQCGYCTPGMVLASYALLSRTPDPTEDEIRRGLAGNLCMCTGYVQIFNAVRAAATLLKQKIPT